MEYLWDDTSHHPECVYTDLFAILLLQSYQPVDEHHRSCYGILYRTQMREDGRRISEDEHIH